MSAKSDVIEQRRKERKEGSMTHAMPPKKSDEELLKEFHDFNKSHSSVVLGTVNASGDADATYAPCLQKNDYFHVYISELAVHTNNLLNHLNASLLFIEPEDKATNLFKRKRSSIRVNAEVIVRDSEEFNALMDDYAEEFGGIMRSLRDSQDFHLFKLKPQHATYVRGFGQAFNVGGTKLDEIKHMRDRGHGKSKLSGHGHSAKK